MRNEEGQILAAKFTIQDLTPETPEKGQVLVFTVFFLLILVICFLVIFNIGKLVALRIQMQNAVDSAAQTAALWQARGLNLEAHLNTAQEILFWTYTGAMATLQFEIAAKAHQTSSEITKIQDKIEKQFPIYVMTQALRVARKNGADFVCPVNNKNPKIAFTLGIKKTYKIPLIKNAFTIYNLDAPKYWSPQERKGPYVTLVAYKKSLRLFNIKLLQLKGKAIMTIAQARPKYKEGVAPIGKVKAGWRAVLMPVRLKGYKNEIILH